MLTHVPEANRFDNPISSPSSSEKTLSQNLESDTEDGGPQKNEGPTLDVELMLHHNPRSVSTLPHRVRRRFMQERSQK